MLRNAEWGMNQPEEMKVGIQCWAFPEFRISHFEFKISISGFTRKRIVQPMTLPSTRWSRTCPRKSLLLGMVTIMLVAQAPRPGYTEESSAKSSQAVIPELELIKEEETVSIASRYEQPISQAPSNVYVITDEDIRHSGATDIPTILRRVPGLDVMQMTGAEFNVSARGNNQLLANKLLVMVDGRSIYVDSQGLTFWKAIPVTLPEIKRIEVLKGPASVLYGFNAFDGIINIITKSPEEMKGTTLQFGGGELGNISSAAIHAGTAGKLGYRLSVGHDQNQQWRNRNALAFRSNKFNIQTEYALSQESKLLVSGGLTDVNRFDGPFTGVTIGANSFSQGYAHVAYERPNFFIRSHWYQVNSTLDFITNPLLAGLIRIETPRGSSIADGVTNTYNIEAQHRVQLWSANQVIYGVNYRLNKGSNTFWPEHAVENRLGFYLQDEWRATQNLTLVAGARYDLHTFIHPTISPRVSLLYMVIPDHTIHATFSIGYRPPTISDRFSSVRAVTSLPLPPPFNTATNMVQGSTNLNPEQIVSYEIGYQGWFLKHRLRIRTDFFFNHISNLISPLSTSPTMTSFANARSADIYGGEAGAEILLTNWLNGFANFTYLEIGQSSSNIGARSGAPRFKVNAGLRGDWDNGLTGEASFFHVGSATYDISQSFSELAPFGASVPSARVGSYNLLNIRVAYKFWQEKAEAGYIRDAEVAFSAYNALNDEHKEHPLGDTIGSRVMGWITIRY
jgi:outer membrane receptor protein involved in Fe transport